MINDDVSQNSCFYNKDCLPCFLLIHHLNIYLQGIFVCASNQTGSPISVLVLYLTVSMYSVSHFNSESLTPLSVVTPLLTSCASFSVCSSYAYSALAQFGYGSLHVVQILSYELDGVNTCMSEKKKHITHCIQLKSMRTLDVYQLSYYLFFATVLLWTCWTVS